MAIDRFSKEEFEEALPVSKKTGEKLWEYVGFIAGEHVYAVPVNNKNSLQLRIVIRSSITFDGFADKSGEDSIRVWVEAYEYVGKELGGDGCEWRSLGKGSGRWTTRVSGWDRRLMEQLRILWGVASNLEKCHRCGRVKRLRVVKKNSPNKGRYFEICSMCDTGFEWLSPRKEKE